jgi:deoxyribonuclease (pyrimidine dimer)
MVRINLIDPKKLADQHLIAEYNEILMLLGYVRLHPKREGIPKHYKLGAGHIKFFKDKLKYIKDRHEIIKVEMKRRNYQTNKTINLNEFSEALANDWTPRKEDFKIIKERIKEKLTLKPEFYTYEREHRPFSFFLDLIDK